MLVNKKQLEGTMMEHDAGSVIAVVSMIFYTIQLTSDKHIAK